MDDLISRQAAIDELVKMLEYRFQADEEVLDAVVTTVRELPSAQPEIIRCKDCKHRDPEDKKCDCGHDIEWQLPRDDYWYCADGERKEDG